MRKNTGNSLASKPLKETSEYRQKKAIRHSMSSRQPTTITPSSNSVACLSRRSVVSLLNATSRPPRGPPAPTTGRTLALFACTRGCPPLQPRTVPQHASSACSRSTQDVHSTVYPTVTYIPEKLDTVSTRRVRAGPCVSSIPTDSISCHGDLPSSGAFPCSVHLTAPTSEPFRSLPVTSHSPVPPVSHTHGEYGESRCVSYCRCRRSQLQSLSTMTCCLACKSNPRMVRNGVLSSQVLSPFGIA